MPWKESTAVDAKREFVALARAPAANIRALCRRFAISPPTGYALLHRYAEEGEGAFTSRSRRPHHSPRRTPSAVEAVVVELRKRHPAWGGRKLHHALLNAGHTVVPSPSAITNILHRHDLIDPVERTHRDWQRFEHPYPNDLWQMDYKGHFAVDAGRCHPLTVLDDWLGKQDTHSRFAVGLWACGDERADTVRACLTSAFRRYGLPARMLMDNGSPWGSNAAHPYTRLTVWLLRLGVSVSHGRPYHPQTQGKEERFHRTLQAEALQGRRFADLATCQAALDRWRDVYNLERPHQALHMATPLSRYAPSRRSFPAELPPITYGDGDETRKVMAEGWVNFQGREFRVGKAFVGCHIGLRPTTSDGVWSVWFMTHHIAELNLRGPLPRVEIPTHV